MARLLLGLTFAVVLGSCTPDYEISVYNNSGQELTVLIGRPQSIRWEAGKFLTFRNLGGEVVGWSEAGALEIAVLSASGRLQKYHIDKREAEKTSETFALRYMNSGRPPGRVLSAFAVSGSVPRSDVCLRVDRDMKMYWFGRGCEAAVQTAMPIPDQPGIFPLTPVG
jgi:hypothetical protein